MSDFNNYMRAQAEKAAAWAERESAGHKYNRAVQAERSAEIKSQHDPLAQIMKDRGVDPFSKGGQIIREMMLEAVRYVQTGRQ